MKEWYTAEVKVGFTAVRRLLNFNGHCAELHGHDFKVHLVLGRDTLDASGLVIDYYWVREQLEALTQTMNFQCLNELPDFQNLSPSCEVLAKWFFEKMQTVLSEAENTVKLTHVTVWENDNFCSTYSQSGAR